MRFSLPAVRQHSTAHGCPAPRAGTTPQGGGGVRSTPWHTPRPADDDSQGGLAGRRVLPSSPSWGLCRSLPLLAVTVASPPCRFLGAALGAALGCLPRP